MFGSSYLYPRQLLIPAPHSHTYGPAVIPGNIAKRVKRTQVTTSPYQVVAQDEHVSVEAAGGVLLPAASAVPEGWSVTVANVAPADNGVIVYPAGTDTIGSVVNGVVSLNSTTVGMATFVSDGVDNWESNAIAAALPT